MIDPRHMTARSWAAQMVPILYRFGAIPALTDEDNWRQWAAIIISYPGIAQYSPPRPEGFKTWQEWAHNFNLALNSALPNA